MKSYIMPSIRLTLVTILVFSGLYPLLIWTIAQATPQRGMAERITEGSRTYYANIGYSFSDERYFWSRPSAVGYHAAGSAGSNKGPSNPDYLAQVRARIDTFISHHPGIRKADIPVDLVTASGSGLDPHISVQAARVQAERISRIRGISRPNVDALIENQVERPILGLFGPSRVNVLKLNIALDGLR
ncbi:MAG: K(+)-transporting ATPase subunit C [Chitinophagaceae bacterium]|nr:K(+)-transporting ATPase subunit C [Chitinophagaceae bacterium]